MLLMVVVAAGIVLFPRVLSHAAGALNMNCTLIVPLNPLSATGLATPYQLTATDPNNGPCHEANKMQAAFVQTAVIDPATGQISVYNPLVTDMGMPASVQPTQPQLPAAGIVGIWFGFNGNTLTLQGSNGSLQQGQCTNGLGGSVFGQFAYCNAPAFFQVANASIQAGKLTPPPLGTGQDGMTCPSVRDFSIVDMDQSDNVTSSYLVSANGQLAQNTPNNKAQMPNAQVLNNASDNGLIDAFIDPSIGCTPWTEPDLVAPNMMATALPLDELQAGFATGTLPGVTVGMPSGQAAQVPNLDPMVLVNGNKNMQKLNLYRAGVDQMQVADPAQSNTKAYCQRLIIAGPTRLKADQALFQNQTSPDAAMASNLFTFLGNRFVNTFEANGLNCVNLLQQPDPVKVQLQGNVAVAATVTPPSTPAMNQGMGANTTATANPGTGTITMPTQAGQPQGQGQDQKKQQP